MRTLRVMLASIALMLLNGQATAQAQAPSLARDLKAEGAASLAKAARERGSAVRGAILFPQRKLDCAKCHASGGRNLLGPDLTKMGEEATDTYLVEAILLPSMTIKKGFESVTLLTTRGRSLSGRIVEQTPKALVLRESVGEGRLLTLAKDDVDEVVPNQKSLMPDELVDQLSDRQQFLDLVRYLMELAAVGPSQEARQFEHSLGGGVASEELRGLVLLGEFNCVACHSADDANRKIPSRRAPLLDGAGGRINPYYLERFIADPLNVKPGTTMPDVMRGLDAESRREASKAITHYLVSLHSATFQPQAWNPDAAAGGRELFHSVGCVACHSPRNEDGSERFAEASAPLGKLQQKYNVEGLAALLENPLAVRPAGRMPNMRLSHWEAVDIAHYLLSGEQVSGDSFKPFHLDGNLAEKGKQHFSQLGCIRCHGDEAADRGQDYPSLKRVRTDRGCLSAKPGAWPRYRLDPTQQQALRAAIASDAKELTDLQRIALSLTAFNCLACHQRGDLGGVSPPRNEYFQTTDQNLGEQGRIPPPLTGVGAKLTAPWIREVLVSGRNIRPYLKTRMPQYGAENVAHLVELFQRVDQLAEAKFATLADQKQGRDAGLELVGSSGLNCVACHTYQRKRSQTMSAVDLTEMAERLHKNWFYRYMREPQRFSHNTLMPSFWPGGRAIRQDILAGDASLQIEALWQYLLDGRQARMPRGVIREPLELVAAEEAVMLRRSYPGIGKRGIGVGYPHQVNLAFDAEQMRLGMIWKGKFADPGGVWGGQGSGTVRPLGGDLIRFAPGPELDDAASPWTVDDGRPPHHRFRGYYLDEQRRPTFLYRFENVDVEDYAIDVKDEQSGVSWIRRTLTFVSEQGRRGAAFRAAADQDLASEGNGTFLIGKSLRIRLDGDQRGQITPTITGKRLRIPLDIPAGKSKLVLEYSW